MTAHTPGPWKIWNDFDEDGDNGCFCIGDDTAHAVTMNFGKKKNKANARLIAAAPDLLAALINLTNRCERSWTGKDTDATRAAIAKATHKQEQDR